MKTLVVKRSLARGLSARQMASTHALGLSSIRVWSQELTAQCLEHSWGPNYSRLTSWELDGCGLGRRLPSGSVCRLAVAGSAPVAR
jgi:hypothetical protein